MFFRAVILRQFADSDDLNSVTPTAPEDSNTAKQAPARWRAYLDEYADDFHWNLKAF